MLAGDTESPPLEPFVTLLPGLDPTTMGWKERAWYLGDHRPRIFDTNGNGGPTVWVDGRIVGGWAQRKTGEVVFRLLEDIGAERAEQVAQQAADAGGRAGGRPGGRAVPGPTRPGAGAVTARPCASIAGCGRCGSSRRAARPPTRAAAGTCG